MDHDTKTTRYEPLGCEPTAWESLGRAHAHYAINTRYMFIPCSPRPNRRQRLAIKRRDLGRSLHPCNPWGSDPRQLESMSRAILLHYRRHHNVYGQ